MRGTSGQASLPTKNVAQKPSTQSHLIISQIRDQTLVLKDGSLRAVLLVSSLNFALKSEDEQNAVIGGYISFLNNIDFPLQILIQSRRLNIDDYLDKLEKLERQQTNDLLRQQTAEYRQFVGELIKMGNIMTKRFYVVVPYHPLSDQQRGFFSRFKETFVPAVTVTLQRERFFKRKNELDKRVSHVLSGLYSSGLAALRLDTQGLVELFYNTYNPEISEVEKLADLNKIRVEM